MGIRFSILGFSQQEVCNLRKVIIKDGKEKELRLDLSDLLILRQIADFPNRKGVLKETINGEVFYWMSYKQVLSELPILNIKKQAFVDRVDKLVALGLVCREYVDKGEYNNMTFLRIGGNYESLLYSNTTGCSSELQEGMVVDYKRGYGSQVQVIDNNNDNIRKENSICAKAPRKTFTPPTVEEVRAYCQERHNGIDAEHFIDHYTANGWMVGHNRMKDWKASVRTWEHTSRTPQNGYRQEKPEEKSNFRYMMDMLNDGTKEEQPDEQ